MINQRPSREADINRLSALRYGSPPIGVMLLRELVRNSEPSQLLDQAQNALNELMDEVSAIARDDSGDDTRREKAAEFLIHLRSRGMKPQSLAQCIDRVAEATAEARCRSGVILDFLATWLFIAGEQFISDIADPRTAIELEVEHPRIWNRFRGNLLELLEAAAQRLRDGRRVRIAETYLARFRLMRARNEERVRADETLLVGRETIGAPNGKADYVVAMIVDLFVLSLSDLQQALVVSQIPPAQSAAPHSISQHDHHRLWQPLRAVRTQQGFERWDRVCQELGTPSRTALAHFGSALAAHLRRTWEWFFPGRAPYGVVRAALSHIESSATEDTAEAAEEVVARLFRRYAETLSFVVKLATEDSESSVLSLEREDSTEGVIGA